jgi:hypothetical protein
MRAFAAALGTSWVLLFGLACNVRAFQSVVDPATENPQTVGAPLQSLSDYLETREEPLEVQPLGITVRDDTGNLDDRAGVRGAAVVRMSVQGASAGILTITRSTWSPLPPSLGREQRPRCYSRPP